jgi:branched-chain amino acid aminotransferase
MSDAKNPYEQGLAFVNGDVVPLTAASIPLVEAGFTRSDVTYDVVSVWNGKFFRLDDHLERFERSRASLRMTLPYDRKEIAGILNNLVARAGLKDAFVSMAATRGVPPSGSRDPRLFTNRFYAFACPFLWVFSREQQERGIRAIVSTVERIPRTSFDPSVKNYMWGDLTAGQWEAIDQGAEAGILLDREHNVTEGAGYNVFAVVDGVVTTPESGALMGITRRTVLELAARNGIATRVGDLHVDELLSADEVFFTTTAGGVMPVGELNGQPIGDGGPGKLTLRIKELFWNAHDDPDWATEVSFENVGDPVAVAE